MLKKRDFISIMDWSSEELINNLELALELKKKTREGQCPKELEGRSYGMIFHKDSLRTRVSCEVAIFQLGGHVLTMSEKDFQMGKRESVKDVAKGALTLSGWNPDPDLFPSGGVGTGGTCRSSGL